MMPSINLALRRAAGITDPRKSFNGLVFPIVGVQCLIPLLGNLEGLLTSPGPPGRRC